MFETFSIKARLSIGFAIVVAMVIVAFTVITTHLSSLTDDVRTINEQTLADVLVAADMNLARSDVQQFLADVSATHDKEGYKDAQEAAQRFKANVEKFRQRFGQRKDTAALDNLNAIDSAFTQFYDLGKRMAEAYLKDGMEAGNTLMKGSDGKPGFDQASKVILDKLDKFSAQQVAQANGTTTIALGKATTMNTVMLLSGLLTALAAALFGALIVRSILRQLGGEPGKAVKVAQNVGAGDLSRAIRLNHGDDNSLLWHLQAMQSNLTKVVSRVRDNAEAVAVASRQIAEGNHELANRTEHQTSSLVQTANAMKELADAVEQNTGSAQHANQLARQAADVAAQGGEVVAQVVNTMRGINESSRKISDIISVIDGIAFQTNILALNAAVAAARAGEQGRGFAVVASEVRSLAGRSAQAAKEITALINASVSRVEQGTTLVDQAGATMEQVVASIGQVTDIMGKISTASHEQSVGVSQMGESIIAFEHATHQNATLVEELDAAARTLLDGASHLLTSMQEFKLSDEKAAPSLDPVQGHAGRHTQMAHVQPKRLKAH